MSSIEHRILAELQKGLPRTRSPYRDMARRIDIEVDQLLSVLRDWKRQGKLRRIGAIVNHFKAGLGAGAMVVWRVETERVKQVGRIFAGFEQVSHAYERQVADGWPYNVYTMVHGRSTEDVSQTVQRMSRACGIVDYRVLATQKELKKVPPTYVPRDEQKDMKE